MRKIHPADSDVRKATAAVEAAVCLPMLVVLVFGAIEMSNGIFLKQSLTMAAYEAAKEASSPGGQAATAERRCEEVLAVREISDFTISFSPTNINADTAAGTLVTVTVTVDADSASLGPLHYFSGRSLSETVTMKRL